MREPELWRLYEGAEFLRLHYNADALFETRDAHAEMPPQDWHPISGIIPSAWPDIYLETHRQAFEPSRFFLNCAQIANYAKTHPADKEACCRILDELIAVAVNHSVTLERARFSAYLFEFKREGYSLSPGWVSALGNGFVLRGLLKIDEACPQLGAMDLAHEYARAFQIINTGGRERPWFTFIDENGFLWLDEYPADDGYPTLVLNGHIHALLGLHAYASRQNCETSAAIVDGALTTMRHNALRFRCPGGINRYSLREPTKVDYLPERTVRQQLELFKLTKDEWFKDAAKVFREDIRVAHTGYDATVGLELYDADGKCSMFVADEKLYRWNGEGLGVITDGAVHDRQGRFIGWIKQGNLINQRGERCFVSRKFRRSGLTSGTFLRTARASRRRFPSPRSKETVPTFPGFRDIWAPDPFIQAAPRPAERPRRVPVARRMLEQLRKLLRRNRTVEFFDRNGKPAVYSEDSRLFSWSGRCVGFISENAVHALDGTFVGWVENGYVVDTDGRAMLFSARSRSDIIRKPFPKTAPPRRAKKQVAPIPSRDGVPEFKGMRVVWTDSPFPKD